MRWSMALADFIISEDKTVLEAMRQIDDIARKILFVTENNKLVATITDGDIRRWILKKGDLSATINNVANYSPKCLHIEDDKNAQTYMSDNRIEAVPLLNKENEVEKIVFWNNEEVNVFKGMDVPIVIMAGGLGTRLYPYTKILPKPLIPVGDIPIIEHIINRFHHQGNQAFYIIVNHKKNMIKAYLNEVEKGYGVEFVDEEKPLGTGGGLSLLKNRFEKPFILTNCDILIESDYEKIYTHHQKEKNFITMVCSLKNIRIPYGVIEIDEDGLVGNIKEKPEFSMLTNTGMYVVDEQVIEELVENEKVDFPEIIEKYRNEGKRIGVYPISEKSWLDMGQMEELYDMNEKISRKTEEY